MKKLMNWVKADEERSENVMVFASLCGTVLVLAVGPELMLWVSAISAIVAIGANLMA
ncbi:MAG: hypothetical protein MJ064_02325 [Lachnospiraceae bacterium]|nr:hypothetical protein [Lachnospiraceae bacterium]